MYDSHKKWSKEEKKYKTIRKLIGKIDPETGQVVPTGPRGRPRRKPLGLDSEPVKAEPPNEATAVDTQALNNTIAKLTIENAMLISEKEKVGELLDDILRLATQVRDLLNQSCADSSK